jgi:N-acetylglutamate synthase-like GNAT family acetyltransferase
VLPPSVGIIPVFANLAVRADARGAGLGQLLVLSCEACAREWGMSEVTARPQHPSTYWARCERRRAGRSRPRRGR